MRERALKAIDNHGIKFNVAVSENVAFWKSLERGDWEPNTFTIFDRYISADVAYFDIGAWIGPTVFYACHLARESYAFELDPVAYAELRSNVEANVDSLESVQLATFEVAVTSDGAPVRIGNRHRGGDSRTSILFADAQMHWDVKSVRLEEFIAEYRISGRIFIKIDIEGGEYDLVPSFRNWLSRYDSTVLLSIHPAYLSMSLRNASSGFLKRVRRRTIFVWKHIQLVRALPTTYLYAVNGKPFKFVREVLRAILFGCFATEILATNRAWGDTQQGGRGR